MEGKKLSNLSISILPNYIYNNKEEKNVFLPWWPHLPRFRLATRPNAHLLRPSTWSHNLHGGNPCSRPPSATMSCAAATGSEVRQALLRCIDYIYEPI